MSVQQPTVRDVSLSARPPFIGVTERSVDRREYLVAAFLFGTLAVTFGALLPAYLLTVPGMGVASALVLPPMAAMCGWQFGSSLRAYLTYPAVYGNGGAQS